MPSTTDTSSTAATRPLAGRILSSLCLGTARSKKGPLWWAVHHRDHHRHSDKEGDIHSLHQQGFYWSHFGWLTSRRNFRTKLENVKDLARFPELRFLDRFDILIPLLLATSLFLLGYALGEFVPNLGTSGPQLIVWGFFVSTVALFNGTFMPILLPISSVGGDTRPLIRAETTSFWLLLRLEKVGTTTIITFLPRPDKRSTGGRLI